MLASLRAALASAEFTYDGVTDALGRVGHAALSRNETTAGRRATRGGSARETLTRLWLLQAPVEARAAERALPGLVEPLIRAGMLTRAGGEVRALLDVRPYAGDDRDWWVVSDLTPGLDAAPVQVAADHVLGISSASTSLAQLTVREPVDRALDLGCGCGVQALHLTQHARQVLATDVNPRALAITDLNARLNEVPVDVRHSDLYDGLDGEQVDLVVSNPPFVVSPATGPRLVYRDSGLPGDEVVRRVVAGAAGHLRAGGLAQVLANWAHVEGQPWEERVASWVDDRSACDVWAVQREVADPAAYVELWLRDAGLDRAPDYAARYDAWLAWFEEQRITGVGFGWVNLRRRPSAPRWSSLSGPPATGPSGRFEHWPYEVAQPLGAEVAAWARRCDTLAALGDDALLATRWRVRDDVRQETQGRPGADDPETIVLRQQRGLRRARQVDTWEAAFVGACDGDLTAGQLAAALGELVPEARPPAEEQLSRVRALVADGFLEA